MKSSHSKRLKPPRFQKRAGETYDQARRRWRVRWAHYRDCIVMLDCGNLDPFYRAFYGVTVSDVVTALEQAEGAAK